MLFLLSCRANRLAKCPLTQTGRKGSVEWTLVWVSRPWIQHTQKCVGCEDYAWNSRQKGKYNSFHLDRNLQTIVINCLKKKGVLLQSVSPLYIFPITFCPSQIEHTKKKLTKGPTSQLKKSFGWSWALRVRVWHWSGGVLREKSLF